MSLKNAHPFIFQNKLQPSSQKKKKNELRIDAHNVNATPSFALSSAFSLFYFHNTLISLYIVADQK